MPDEYETIDLRIGDSVASLTLDRPPVNAIDETMIEELDAALNRIEGRDGLSVLHVRSKQKAFCAGADLKLMRECLATDEGRDRMIDIVRRLQRVIDRVERLELVTLAEIGGAALGGGLELALACDLRVASGDARLGLPEAGLGLLPAAGGTQRLPRISGEAIARRLILGAEVIDGVEAHQTGLAHWVVGSDELREWTDEFVLHLGSLPSEALAACKRCIAAASDESVDGFELELKETRRLHDVAETQRRIRSFLDKSG